jgi:hypothetical protein
MVDRRRNRGDFLMRWVWLGAAVLAGCASQVTDDPREGGRPDARRDGMAPWTDPDGAIDVSVRDVLTYDVFREDVCGGDAGAGVRMYECDPFAPTTGCPSGEGCYPSIEYPSEPCDREIYRAQCRPVGVIPVDGFCGGGEVCAPGLACFVTGAGNRCLALCRIDGGEPRCPRGRVCEPTDLPDFGACD